MILENGKWYLEEKARKLARAHPELVRRVGVTVLNVAMRGVPPNSGSASQKSPGKAGVKSLKGRIAAEVIGGGFDKPQFSTAIHTSTGAAVRWGGPGKKQRSVYGFVVPRNPKDFRVNYVDAEKIVAERTFRRKGNVIRSRGPKREKGEVRWVKKEDLLAIVKNLQKNAGRLIGGLYPAAKALNVSTAERNYMPGQTRRRGWAHFSQTPTDSHLRVGSDWGSLIVGKRFLSQFPNYIRIASQKGIRNTENWFLKFLFD